MLNSVCPSIIPQDSVSHFSFSDSDIEPSEIQIIPKSLVNTSLKRPRRSKANISNIYPQEPESKISPEISAEQPSCLINTRPSPGTSLSDSRSNKKTDYPPKITSLKNANEKPGVRQKIINCSECVIKKIKHPCRTASGLCRMKGKNISHLSQVKPFMRDSARSYTMIINSRDKSFLKFIGNKQESIIEETSEETMLTEYWQVKEDVEEKYKKLLNNLEIEEAFEIKLLTKKLMKGNIIKPEELASKINEIKEEYDFTRDLILKQKITEVEELINKFQRKLLV